jgi:hypothetical protein
MIKEYKEFTESCDKRVCLRGTIYNANTCKTDRKRKRCYPKYCAKLTPKEHQIDEDWEFVKKEVDKRDMGQCRLSAILTEEERKIALSSPGFDSHFGNDRAHIIRRSQSKTLYYEPKNIVLLKRVFHSRLDQFKNPVSGHSITKEEANKWWERIVGEATWAWLNKNK